MNVAQKWSYYSSVSKVPLFVSFHMHCVAIFIQKKGVYLHVAQSKREVVVHDSEYEEEGVYLFGFVMGIFFSKYPFHTHRSFISYFANFVGQIMEEEGNPFVVLH